MSHTVSVEYLVKDGLVTSGQLDQARDEVRRTGAPLDKVLERLGFVTREGLMNSRAHSLGLAYVDLSNYIFDPELFKLIPEEIAKKYRVVPLCRIGRSLTVAMADPQDILALDHLVKASRMDAIDPVLASEEGIQKTIDTCYAAAMSLEDLVESIAKEKAGAARSRTLAESAEEPPVVRFVNALIAQAVKDRASDIHLEPEASAMRVRFRIDGLLHESVSLPEALMNPVISRVKILAGMDIGESRRPQDGRIRMKLTTRNIDMRVSSFPTVYGENVVIRVLDTQALGMHLADLKFTAHNLEAFESLVRQPHGIVLVTGPTGSGKTTTLYAALQSISSMEKNIITIEDPVEYELPIIRQTQVNPKADITFANGLRSILRQDPDVIMVGEIRDKETAEVAIQAALTGHLVFSTLHTNDAASALTRLIDMGIEPFLVSSSVAGIVAQRLVRALCPACKQKYAPGPGELKIEGLEGAHELYRHAGCPQCKQTGFAGRFAISELLIMDDGLRALVNEKRPAEQMQKAAQKAGMRLLREDGIDKVKAGLTSLDEVLRVASI